VSDLFAVAANFVGSNEGFIGVARWDVDAYRVGFGSDTRTARQIPVKKGDTETRADALGNLALRLRTFYDTCERQCGAFWGALPVAARVALLDMAYNYGSLPEGVVASVQRTTPGPPDLEHIASAVRAHRSDNRGINAKRREREAEMIEKA
jgi:hypothetical protein